MKIGILGGGLCGLVAANAFAGEHNVVMFEKMPFLGGCLASYHIDEYWIERYYHHCFSGDEQLFTLIRELGLWDKLEWREGRHRLLFRRYTLPAYNTFANPALAGTIAHR